MRTPTRRSPHPGDSPLGAPAASRPGAILPSSHHGHDSSRSILHVLLMPVALDPVDRGIQHRDVRMDIHRALLRRPFAAEQPTLTVRIAVHPVGLLVEQRIAADESTIERAVEIGAGLEALEPADDL